MRDQWLAWLGTPESGCQFEHSVRKGSTFETSFCKGEYYCIANGKGTFQNTLLVLPREVREPLPAVVVPFYYPEGMMGCWPGMLRKLVPERPVSYMMEHLVKRGYACISAESYHLTYCRSERPLFDFYRWRDNAKRLYEDHPCWSGVGKLFADTELLVDFLEKDTRIDSSRIGIAGHSLGGKIAFYTGCLDSRIKVILASDFGFHWDQTNWADPWYWGQEKIAYFKAQNVDHTSLLACAAPKPFGLLAGFYDNEESGKSMYSLDAYKGEYAENLLFDNHASGHAPPAESLEKGYAFLDRFLK
ncbi:MAG: acetylxylan esterase [Lentisphaeria bacterium]|nr:acetylxylan esterase [Lentisphaeria bacterium]